MPDEYHLASSEVIEIKRMLAALLSKLKAERAES
jgi:hypothetical protein